MGVASLLGRVSPILQSMSLFLIHLIVMSLSRFWQSKFYAFAGVPTPNLNFQCGNLGSNNSNFSSTCQGNVCNGSLLITTE